MQGDLFPIDAVWCGPANLGTADCSTVCRGSDGCDYVIKDGIKNPLIPHSEWFCTHLGELIGLASPPCRVIRMPDKSLVFGSRWEGGVFKDRWPDKLAKGEIKLADIAPVFSRIHAFDHFVHNTDRHAGNFLFREQKSDYVIMAFDYSRSWLCNGFPLPNLPFGAGQNTRKMQQQLAAHVGKYIDPALCAETLEKLAKTPKAAVEKIINESPSTWLPEEKRKSIFDWWGSPDMITRINAIAKGIKDGTYL